MSLEFELDCAGFDKSKHNELATDNNHHTAAEYEDEMKEQEESEEDIDDGEHTGEMELEEDRYQIQIESAKQKEQIAHWQELCQESATKMSSYEFDLEQLRQQNETYESQLDVFLQRNDCLQAELAEWKSKYNQAQQELSSAKEENFALKRELTNLQISYEQDVKQIKNENKLILNGSAPNDDYLNQELQAYMKQYLQIKKENKAYLDQLTQLNEQCREAATKYEDLKNMQIDLQKELNQFKSKATELTEVNAKQVEDIQFYVNENALLRQTLSELQQQTKSQEDEHGNQAIEISYPPSMVRTRTTRWRTRSASQVSAVSCAESVESPVMNCDGNDELKFMYEDLYQDDLSDETSGRTDEHQFYDLFEALNDHLHAMSEYVRVIQNIKSMHKPRSSVSAKLVRGSSLRLGVTPPMHVKGEHVARSAYECDENKMTESEWVSNSDVEIDDEEEEEHAKELATRASASRSASLVDRECFQEAEVLLDAIDANEEEELIASVALRIHQSKECVNELHKQQMVMMATERTKYSDLDTAYQHYRIQTKRKIKQLTKDMYQREYKKYGGYREIAWDLVGNMGSYTKDAIIYKLTH